MTAPARRLGRRFRHGFLDGGRDLDREDLLGALDAFGEAVERRIDLAEVGGHVFVNNVSLGIYAKIVQSPEYRDAKRETTAKLLPELLGPDAQPYGMTFADPAGKVDADVLLDAVEEMRDAGAEVIEVNDSVRVVASTWFGTGPEGLLVDGVPVSRPITFEVIGDPHSLEEAARFRGGLVSEITGAGIGGQVQIDQEDRVVVESLHAARENQYAQPASPPPTAPPSA